MRGNFLDVPTDCPQRDERLGWTGDIQVFSPTATLPVRQRRLPHLLARRPGRRAAQGRLGAVRRPGRARATRARRPRPGATRRRSCPGCSTSAPATPACSPGSCRACAPGSTGWPAWPAATCCGPAASSSATGSTRPRRRTNPFARQGRPRRRRHRAPGPLGRDRRAGGRGASASTDVARQLRRPGRAGPGGVRRASTSPPAAGCSATRRPTYALALRVGAAARPRSSGTRAGRRLADLVRTSGFRISTGFVGTPLISDALTVGRRGRPGVPPAAADRLPVLAVRGDDGRHDGLGALGQHAARRQHQPRRDDVVQPLRARRGRRLDAPPRRRARPGDAGLPRASRCARCPAAQLTDAPRRATSRRTARQPWPGPRDDGRFTLPSRCRSAARRRSPARTAARRSRSATARHEWTSPTRTPSDRALPADADDARQLLDHEPTWAAVVAAAVEAEVVADDADLAAPLERYLDHPAAELDRRCARPVPRRTPRRRTALQAELDGTTSPH